MAKKISINSQKLADQLHSLAIHLLRRLRREDDSSGLNAPRLSALSVIVFGGPVTLGDLAAAEQVRPPTMTRIVNALEELGLVTKEKSSSDGRSIHLSATAGGRELLLAGRERRVRALAAQVESLNPPEKEVLAAACEILQKIVHRMQMDAQ
jgi:DNA-binding MarR family transcriptional regulator